MAETLEGAKKTPLYSLHVELGGRIVPFAGYAMPVQFPEGIMAEHLWTRENAGLFDVSHMGQVILTGKDVDRALESIVPADVLGLKQNRLRYSLLLNEQGGVLDDLMITRRAEDLLLVVNGAVKHTDIEHMRHYLEPQGGSLSYREDWALLALQGPKAVIALARLAPDCTQLTFMTAAAIEVAGVPAWVSRSGYTGEDGFEISMPAAQAEAVARALLAQPEVKPIGLGARDSLRLEAGLPLYGHDLSPEISPVQADLVFAISKRRKAEGGFLGSSVVLDQIFNGTFSSKRVGLALEGRLPAREGALVLNLAGERVGIVTSGGFAPSVGGPIAMAYVDIKHAADGENLTIEVRGKALSAKVVPMPFIPHRYVRTTSQQG